MERASVVIIGGGVYGTSIAYHLAAMGCGEVVLLEKDSLACGSSGKSCALVRQHYSNEITARAAMESRKFFEVFEEEVVRKKLNVFDSAPMAGYSPPGGVMAV